MTPQAATRTRRLARKRGFRSVSGYVRFLLETDDEVLIGEDEILRRSMEAHRLHKVGKLVAVKTLKDLLV